MKRILVVGNAGAGKSTFARRLGGKLALPVIHLDVHFWQPGWRVPETSSWRQRLMELAASPAWVMDGNYINTFDIRLPRAEGLVWLDYPRGICMRRVLVRTIMGYGRTRSDVAEGCPDPLRHRIPALHLEVSGQATASHRCQHCTIWRRSACFQLGCDCEVENFLTTVAPR